MEPHGDNHRMIPPQGMKEIWDKNRENDCILKSKKSSPGRYITEGNKIGVP